MGTYSPPRTTGSHHKHFIQKMHLKKGAFTASAQRAGMSVHAYAEKEKHASGTLGRRARLALVFEGMHH